MIFLKNLFDILNKNNVRYAVLRNYASLPDSLSGSDLDIYVHPTDKERAIALLENLVKDLNAFFLGKVKSNNFYQASIVGKDGKWYGLCIDFYFGLMHKSSVNVVSDEFICSTIETYKNIYIIPNKIGNSIAFFKEILHRNKMRDGKEYYRNSFYDLNSLEIKNLFGYKNYLSILMLKSFPKKYNFNIYFFRLSFILLNLNISTIFKRLIHEFGRIKRFFCPPGVFCVFMGVDGAGKSTLINEIEPILKEATHGAYSYNHLRPMLLPKFEKNTSEKNESNSNVVMPHAKKPSGNLVSYLRIIYLFVDYLFGYWVIFRKKLAKSPYFLCFDRYGYDLKVDSKRFRVSPNNFLINAFVKFIPKPDIVFCLIGDPVVINSRKNEVSLDETVRQINEMKNLNLPCNTIYVETDKKLDAAVDEVFNGISRVVMNSRNM